MKGGIAGLANETAEIDVLMYHSISTEPGPTSIAPGTFKMQMDALATRGYQTISLEDFAAWRRGEKTLPGKSIVITFDDGFLDFAECAHPIMRAHGFTATVFLPSDCIGGVESWAGANARPRALMRWEQIRALANDGIDFGGHSLTHADLTRVTPQEMRRQVGACKDAIEQHTGRRVTSFAPPYGRSTPELRAEIARYYEISVGTRLGRATRSCDPFDVPRIEMFYFCDAARWHDHLDNRGGAYLRVRQFLRGARAALRSA